MIVVCSQCDLHYDDAYRWTFCPHDAFITKSAAKQKDLAFSLSGEPLRFAHDPEFVSSVHIQTIDHEGMVTLREHPQMGSFAPHLFVVQSRERGNPVISTKYSHGNMFNLDNIFTYHPPFGDQPERYAALREKGKELAQMILDYCPPCADTSATIRLLRETLMAANQSIACNEKQEKEDVSVPARR